MTYARYDFHPIDKIWNKFENVRRSYKMIITNTHFIEETRFDIRETESFDKGCFSYESQNYNNRTFIYYTAALS